MPRFEIHHITNYHYDAPVSEMFNQIKLYPIEDDYQEVVKHRLEITYDPEIFVFKDYWGNRTGTFGYNEKCSEMSIHLHFVALTKPMPVFSDSHSAQESWAMIQQLTHQPEFIDFLRNEGSFATTRIAGLIKTMQAEAHTPFELLTLFSNYIYENFKYIKGITSVESTLDEVWELKAGVCQDFATVLLAMLRIANIPARYVSGYICPNKHGLRGEGATHAWVEAYIPFQGWVGIDPTNKKLANEEYVRLGIGRNFADCTPVKGTFKGNAEQILEVIVSVGYEDGVVIKDMIQATKPQRLTTAKPSKKLVRVEQQQQQQ
jgi:transglutaminase-like putative cysteine protease